MMPKNEKKSPAWLPLAVVALGILITVSEELSEDAVLIIIGFAIMLLPVAVIFLVVKAAARQKKPDTHTHDRIDHSRDLQINPQTGKAAPIRSAQPHSPKEHWLQQLDALYKNGTIDANEYRAMRNRKF